MANQLDVGSILSETASIVQDNKQIVLLYAAVIGGVTAVGILFGLTEASGAAIAWNWGGLVSTENGLLGGLLDLFLAIGSIVGLYWLSKSFLASRNRIVHDENRFWHYLGMTILASIGMVIGFALLIVPGIILLVRWSAANGFLLSGREGVIDSLKASWEATRGNALMIFLAGLVMFLVLGLLTGFIASILAVLSPVAGQMIGALMEAAVNAVLPAFGIAVYCLLEDNGENLEEVFS